VRAFRWANGRGTDLGTLAGHTGSQAFGLNHAGLAVGYSTGPGGARAVVWPRGGAIQALAVPAGAGATRAYGVNTPGDVVGSAGTGISRQALLWSAGGAPVILATPSGAVGAEAVAINAKKEVVGYAIDLDGRRRALRWSPGAPPQQLATLPGADTSAALGINNAGDVVGMSAIAHGTRAVLWPSGGAVNDLNDLVLGLSGAVLLQAVAINANGAILATGREVTAHAPAHQEAHEFATQVYLLRPAPGTAPAP
jgi:probable HAF family extracellular repeat protein